MAPNNLYIDAILIDSDNGSAYSGNITNHLALVANNPGLTPVNSSVSTTSGYKWVIQLVNGTASTIQPTFKIQICTAYLNSDGEANSSYDHEIIITSETITSGSSYYIGHDLVSGISINTADSTYIAAQKNASGQIISAPRIRLFTSTDGTNWTALDLAGTNDPAGDGEYYTNSIVHLIQSKTNTNDGICRRKPAVTSPNTSFTTTDWLYTGSTTATALRTYLIGTAYGDPHITTLTGDHYEFDYLGAFRLFEDTIQGNKIIINGLSEKGPGRWSKKQYIQKLYIQHNQKYILVDMGFRGSPVKVLENNQMDYTEEVLPFDSEAKRYSFNSTYSTKNQDESVTEDLPALIRNQFSLLINSEKTLVNIMHITLQNVNQYNLQPCRFSLNSTKITDNAKGCLVDKKYVPVSKLSAIKDTHELPEPSKEDLKNIPELEIDPKLRNIQWE